MAERSKGLPNASDYDHNNDGRTSLWEYGRPNPNPPKPELDMSDGFGGEEGKNLQKSWLNDKLEALFPTETDYQDQGPPTAKSVGKKIVAEEDAKRALADMDQSSGYGGDYSPWKHGANPDRGPNSKSPGGKEDPGPDPKMLASAEDYRDDFGRGRSTTGVEMHDAEWARAEEQRVADAADMRAEGKVPDVGPIPGQDVLKSQQREDIGLEDYNPFPVKLAESKSNRAVRRDVRGEGGERIRGSADMEDKAPPTAKSVGKKIAASEAARRGSSFDDLKAAKAKIQMNDGFGKDAWTTPSKGVKDPAAPEGAAEEPMVPVSTGGPNNGTDAAVNPGMPPKKRTLEDMDQSTARGGSYDELQDAKADIDMNQGFGESPDPETNKVTNKVTEEGPPLGIYGAEGDDYLYEIHPEEGVRFRKVGATDGWQSAEGRNDGAKEAILAQIADNSLSLQLDMSDLHTNQNPFGSNLPHMRAARYAQLE